jgi:hypothetical protein
MCFSRSAIRAPNARHKLIDGSGCLLSPPRPSLAHAAMRLRGVPFLVPPLIFSLRFFLESLHLDLDSRDFLRVLPLGPFQRCLRLVNAPLASFTLPLTSSLLDRPLPLAPFLLFFESESGVSLSRLVAREGRRLLRFLPFRPAGCFRRSFIAAQIGSSACSLNDPSDSTGRLRTTPGFSMAAAMTSGSSLSFAAPW